MLLPQSSAFAALKNRLGSVSAIGYLHVAPRGYVSSYSPMRGATVTNRVSLFEEPITTEAISTSVTQAHQASNSTTATSGPSNYDRPNRLKGRDEPGIKWTELLDKFKAVQEKVKRSMRGGLGGGYGGSSGGNHSFGMADLNLRSEVDQRSLADLARMQTPTPPLLTGSKAGTGAAAGPSGAPAQGHKSRASLSTKFGRLGGGISGSRPKK